MLEQYKVLTEEEWEKTRDERVDKWRDFSKQKTAIGTKKSNKVYYILIINYREYVLHKIRWKLDKLNNHRKKEILRLYNQIEFILLMSDHLNRLLT